MYQMGRSVEGPWQITFYVHKFYNAQKRYLIEFNGKNEPFLQIGIFFYTIQTPVKKLKSIVIHFLFSSPL